MRKWGGNLSTKEGWSPWVRKRSEDEGGSEGGG